MHLRAVPVRYTQTQHTAFVSGPKHVAEKYRVVWTVLLVTDRYAAGWWCCSYFHTDPPAGQCNRRWLINLQYQRSLCHPDRPTRPWSPVVFFRPRSNAQLVPKIHVALRDSRVVLPKTNVKFSVQTTTSKHKTQPQLSAPSQYLPSSLPKYLLCLQATITTRTSGTRTFSVVNFISPFRASTALVTHQYPDTSDCVIDGGIHSLMWQR